MLLFIKNIFDRKYVILKYSILKHENIYKSIQHPQDMYKYTNFFFSYSDKSTKKLYILIIIYFNINMLLSVKNIFLCNIYILL